MMKSWLFLVALVFSSPVYAETVNVEMTTSLGVIEMEVYPDAAPITASNFLFSCPTLPSRGEWYLQECNFQFYPPSGH